MKYVFRKKWLIILISILDAAGFLLSGLVKFFTGGYPGKKPERILVIRLDHIGDVMLSGCVLKPLRDKYPEAEIDYLGPSPASEIIEGNPYVNNIIKFNAPWFSRERETAQSCLRGFFRLKEILKSGRYDTAIDLRGDLRHIAAMFFAGVENRISYGITGGGFLLTRNIRYDSSQHEALKNLTLLSSLGIDERRTDMEIFYSEKELALASELRESAGLVGVYAVIHAVPGREEKKWSVNNFFEVIKYIRDIKKLLPVFIGSEKDKMFIHEIMGLLAGGVVDLSGKTDLKTTAKLISDAALFIGLDSGPAHIAAATNTPAIVLFSGVNNADQWAPAGDNINVICPGKARTLSEVTSAEVCRLVDEKIGMNVTGRYRL
jgi:ADP-heptose:LPS heptosyltransferase